MPLLLNSVKPETPTGGYTTTLARAIIEGNRMTLYQQSATAEVQTALTGSTASSLGASRTANYAFSIHDLAEILLLKHNSSTTHKRIEWDLSAYHPSAPSAEAIIIPFEELTTLAEAQGALVTVFNQIGGTAEAAFDVVPSATYSSMGVELYGTTTAALAGVPVNFGSGEADIETASLKISEGYQGSGATGVLEYDEAILYRLFETGPTAPIWPSASTNSFEYPNMAWFVNFEASGGGYSYVSTEVESIVAAATTVANQTRAGFLTADIASALGLEPLSSSSSSICFAEGTPILTDQGLVAVENLSNKVHTIANLKLIGVCPSENPVGRPMIRFAANSLGHGVPTQDTYVTRSHKVYDPVRRRLRQARLFLNLFENVTAEMVDNNRVYNIVVEDEEHLVKANGMKCESLNHSNVFAKMMLDEIKEVETEVDDIVSIEH